MVYVNQIMDRLKNVLTIIIFDAVVQINHQKLKLINPIFQRGLGGDSTYDIHTWQHVCTLNRLLMTDN